MPVNRVLRVCALMTLLLAVSAGQRKLSVSQELPDIFDQLPLSFEANHGQMDEEVKFLYRGADRSLFLTATEAVLVWTESGQHSEVRMGLAVSNPAPQLSGEDLQPGKLSYLNGEDESRWIGNVLRYGRVRYSNVYPGVDLLFYARNRELEFDFVVAPGGNPHSIKLVFQGADHSRIDADGALVIKTANGQTRLQRPNVYQNTVDGRISVSGAYRIDDSHQLTFEIGDYDSEHPLIIDPVWGKRTSWAGSPVKVAVDSDGGVYVTGQVRLSEYPNAKRLVAGNFITPGVLVAKMKASLDSLEYAVILGGGGENPDRGMDIAVDRDKYVYVTGHVGSTRFPTKNAIQSNCILSSLRSCFDAFVARLDPAGDLVFSTYFGTSSNEEGRAIAADSNGNSYIAIGNLSSSSDVSILKLNADGERVFNQRFGGSSLDVANAIEVDDEGNIYVVGDTWSPDFFPIKNALQPKNAGGTLTAIPSGGPFPLDAFVTKLDPTGAVLFSTFLGGSGNDNALDVAVDAEMNVIVTGTTSSADFPTVQPVQAAFAGGRPPVPGSSAGGDVFVAKLNSSGSALVYATYLGGTGDDEGLGVAVDLLGNAYVTGLSSANFPIHQPIEPVVAGFGGFAAKLTTLGALIWSASLAGILPAAIELDSLGNAYVLASSTLLTIEAMEHSFTISGRPGLSLATSGVSDPMMTGYGRIQLDSAVTPFAAQAIFGLRQNGILIGEAAVPATSLSASGRIPVDGTARTGLAIANPNDQPATVAFFFTNGSGLNSGEGTTTIAAKSQIAAFLHEDPFRGSSAFQGTFTFTSAVPVAAIALRGLINERSEFLMTTLPVVDLSLTWPAAAETVIFPHFADGGGWSTQIDLVNPTDAPISGVVRFFDSSGQTYQTFSYSIAARSSQVMQTSGISGIIRTGSVHAIPSAGDVPAAGIAVFTYKKDGITVSEASVPASRAGKSFRLFVERSIQTGVAISNRSQNPVVVDLELISTSGTTGTWSGTVTVPGNGQLATFLTEIPGLQELAGLAGVLRVSTGSTEGVAVVGLRGRYNERGDFLICAINPWDESIPRSASELFFPHIADGGGYTTQFVLMTAPNQSSSGELRFFSTTGQPLHLFLR